MEYNGPSTNLLYGYLKRIDQSICDMIHPELFSFMVSNFPRIKIIQKREFYENTNVDLDFATVFFAVYKPNGIYGKNGMHVTIENYAISNIESFEKKFGSSLQKISEKYEACMIEKYYKRHFTA